MILGEIVDPSIVAGAGAAGILSVLWALVRAIGRIGVAVTAHLTRVEQDRLAQERHRRAEARHWIAVERALSPRGERPTLLYRDPGES